VKIHREGEHFHFELAKGEQKLLWEILQLYPCISQAARPGRPHKSEPNAELLEEALADQRAENKNKLRVFLEDPTRVQTSEKGVGFVLSNSEIEWLLQVINDVRVGSWIHLGAPEEKFELKLLDERNAPHFWAMEMAGHFEMQLLAALR